jgi:hypothetical protein
MTCFCLDKNIYYRNAKIRTFQLLIDIRTLSSCRICARKYEANSDCLMDYRGPGFLAVVLFGSSPPPTPPTPVSKLDGRHQGNLRKRDNLLKGGGGGGEEEEAKKRESLVLPIKYSLGAKHKQSTHRQRT